MTTEDTPPRTPLSRERIFRAAVDLADLKGLEALTMRALGAQLGVEAMALYKHVANKDEILDGIIEQVIAEIEIPAEGVEWREAMRRRAVSAREVLSRHSWAIGLFESRGPTGPAVMRYLDGILGNLRSSGFSIENAAHAFWLLDSYVYGHVVQETSLVLGSSEKTSGSETSESNIEFDGLAALAEIQRHALTSEFSFDEEFQFGLELILDGLDDLREGD